MALAALILGIIGAITGGFSLYYSHRATSAAETSANGVLISNANQLTPDIDIERVDSSKTSA